MGSLIKKGYFLKHRLIILEEVEEYIYLFGEDGKMLLSFKIAVF